MEIGSLQKVFTFVVLYWQKPYGKTHKIGGDSWKTKTLIVQQSSFTVAEEANKKSTVLPQGYTCLQ